MSDEVLVVEEPERAAALLAPARLELLEHLDRPRSAAALGRLLGLPRQRVNYHLRELEDKGLVELVEERARGRAVERLYRRKGDRYALSDRALGRLACTPDEVQDRFSSAYQIALASRAVRELAALREGARSAGKQLPTFSLASDVRFASAAARAAFAEELTRLVGELVERYHDAESPGGRWFRFHLGGYPRPKDAGEARAD